MESSPFSTTTRAPLPVEISAERSSELRDVGADLQEVAGGDERREREGEEGIAGCRPHRRELAEAHCESLESDGGRRRECTFEMHSLDERVGRDDAERSAFGLN